MENKYRQEQRAKVVGTKDLELTVTKYNARLQPTGI
jgi:hypothetical protein